MKERRLSSGDKPENVQRVKGSARVRCVTRRRVMLKIQTLRFAEHRRESRLDDDRERDSENFIDGRNHRI